jgi:hypothetical protein
MNAQAKCELAYHLSKSEAGKKLRQDNGIKFAMVFGTILHHACQTYDIDRFTHKIDVPKTSEEIQKRYEEAWEYFFTNEASIKKEKINEEQQELAVKVILPKLKEWLWEESVKKQAELSYFLKAQQDKMMFIFMVKKPLSWYYEDGFKLFYEYIMHNPLDIYGIPIEFQVEKGYPIKYGDTDDFLGYIDERLVFLIDGKKSIFLRELKTSATPYTPEDCQVDNQMGLYVFYENIDTGTPLEDIYVVMHQLPTGLCTITQRTEENLDYLLRHAEERLRRQNEVDQGVAEPLPSCGTNSFDHSRLMCDYKDICPIWNQIKNQPKPIVLGTPKGKSK